MEGEPLYDKQWYFLSFTVMRLMTLLCMAAGGGIVVSAAMGGEPVLLLALLLLPLAWLAFLKTNGRLCRVHASPAGVSVQGIGVSGVYGWEEVEAPRVVLRTGGLVRARLPLGGGRTAEFVCRPEQWSRLSELQGAAG